MRLELHHHAGQKASCLESLEKYAQEIARTAFAKSFATLGAFTSWCRLQEVKEDCGDGPQRGGCSPSQRSRVWPLDGMNCWEATAHFVGVAMALRPDVVVHVYDVETAGGGRHVFPALQSVLGGAVFEVVLQVEQRAQGWVNTLADVAHGIGGAVLGAFGAGALVPLIDQAWKQAPEEYGLSRNRTAVKEQQPSVRAVEIAELQKRLAALLAEEKSAVVSGGGGGGGGASSSKGENSGRTPQDRDRAVIEEAGGMIEVEAAEVQDTDAAVVDFLGETDTDTAAVEYTEAVDGSGTDTDSAAVEYTEAVDVSETGISDTDSASVSFDE